MSDNGYSMMFGSDVKKKFFQKQIRGRGYCDMGTSVITEFYTPLVPREDVYKRQLLGLLTFSIIGDKVIPLLVGLL